MFSKFVNKVAVTYRTILGTLIAVVGTVATVVFGPNADRCYTLDDLSTLWSHTVWCGSSLTCLELPPCVPDLLPYRSLR